MLKKFLVFLLGSSLLVPAFLIPNLAYAANAIRFVIEAPNQVTQHEAFDVTVKAVDENGNVDTNYRGSVIFNTDWIADTIPTPTKAANFTEDDAGVKKFSKWVIFKKVGENKLYVTSSGDDLVGEVSISVREGNVVVEKENVEVSLITPTDDTKIATNVLTISGKTRKNSKVSLSLNGKDVGMAISDEDGLFTKEISDITQENNIIKANVLDANNDIIGSSKEVRFVKSNETSSVYGLQISPNSKVESSSDITFTLEALKGLDEVNLMIDGAQMQMKEAVEWKYTLSTKAPQKEGMYPITVTAKTVTNQVTTKENIATLEVVKKPEEPTVESPKPQFKDIKAETKDSRVTFTFEIENVPMDLHNFRINYGDNVAVVTQEAGKILKDGKYTWYIDNLLPGDYVFKIQWQKVDNTIIDTLISDVIPATIGVKSCTISNVGKISVNTNASKSVLTWDAVKDAVAYNVYQVDDKGKYALITKTTEPKYTIYLSQWVVKYDNFAIKAVCWEGTESADYSDVSKVQTGPGMIAFFVILSALIGGFILRRRSL